MTLATSRSGLSRLDTLTLAGIAVLALGLLAPALARVQAAARGNDCVINLRAIAIAMHNYHDTYGRMPPGTDRQYVGVLVSLLPYLEQQPVYDNFSFSAKYNLFWQNPYNRPATDGSDKVPRPPEVYGSEGEVSYYLCPDAPQPQDTVTALLAVRYGTPGVDFRIDDKLADGHLYSGSPGRLVMARSHYLGIGGDWRTEPPYNGLYRGIFTYNSRTRIADIFDGSSNTLAFAESWGANVPWEEAGGIPSGWTVASRSAGFNFSTFGPCPNPKNPNCDYDGSYGLSAITFGGLHGKKYDRFNVAFADGSVRSLPGTIDFNLWTVMSGARDGMVEARSLSPELGSAFSD